MKILAKLLITAIAVVLASYFFQGVQVASIWIAILVAALLAFLNAFLKPLLIILTIPVTILTFGLFLLVINAFIILLISSLVDGFSVANWWVAIGFSLMLSLINTLLEKLILKTH